MSGITEEEKRLMLLSNQNQILQSIFEALDCKSPLRKMAEQQEKQTLIMKEVSDSLQELCYELKELRRTVALAELSGHGNDELYKLIDKSR